MTQKLLQTIKIIPAFGFSQEFVDNLQKLISSTQKPFSAKDTKDPFRADIEKIQWENWANSLPLIFFRRCSEQPLTLCASFIYRFEYTQGVDRHIAQILSKWLLPQSRLKMDGSYFCRFRFPQYAETDFAFTEFYFPIKNYYAMRLALKNSKKIAEELKVHILSIYYTRQIFAKNEVPSEKRLSVIKEHLSSVTEYLQHPRAENTVQSFSKEEISWNVGIDVQQAFQEDRSDPNKLFEEMQRCMLLLPTAFAGKRTAKHLSRILSFFHILRKKMEQSQYQAPKQRTLLIKAFRTSISCNKEKKNVLGVLICVNLLSETESFHRRHILEALSYLVPDVFYVKDSYIFDRRSQDPIRSIYLELEQKHGLGFTLEMIKTIKQKLPAEIVRRMENVLYPIFMPRNEEELMRNIILLSNQLRFVKDLPQVMICYENQTHKELVFTIIIARLLRPSSFKFFEVPHYLPNIRFFPEQKKTIGRLKNKYDKEVWILRACISKTAFFRNDYSLDLQKARRTIVHELTKIIGDFRDYNGGMILKKTQSFDALRAQVPQVDAKREFLLENFFYSIKPAVMQTILATNILKALFQLLLEGMEHDFSEKTYNLLYGEKKPYFLSMMVTSCVKLSKAITLGIKKLGLSSYDLVTCSFSLYELLVVGVAYKFPNKKAKKVLKNTLETIVSKHA